jgi:hypothetical protein
MHFKVSMRTIFLGATGLVASFFWVTAICSPEGGVFSKRRDLPLLEAANPDAKTVAKAEWNEELKVLSTDGRWMKVSAKDGEGWVYGGNISKTKLPEENKNDLPIKASEMNAGAAGRSLSGGAEQYAGRHNLGDAAGQVKWAEKFSKGISKADAIAYLKAHKLGEYAEKK